MKIYFFFFCFLIALHTVNAQSTYNPELIKKEKEEEIRKKLGVSGLTITKHKNGIIKKKGEVINISRFNNQGKLIYEKLSLTDINSTLPKQFLNSKSPLPSDNILHVAEYEYDDNGNLIKEISSNKSNNLDFIMTYEYDKNYNLINKKTYTKTRKEEKKTLKSIKIYNGLYTTTYNVKGDTLSISISGYNKEKNKYFVNNKYLKSNLEKTKTYVLNKKTLIQQSKSVMSYPFGVQSTTISYQYDLNDNEVKNIYNSKYPLGRQRIRTDIVYDSNELIFKKTSLDKEKNKKTILVYKYEFFEN